MRTRRSLTLAVATVAGLLLTGAGPASANGVGGDIGGGGTGPSDGIVSGSAYGEAAGCGFIASTTYWGGVCGGGVGRALTPKEILGKDPVPTCWHEALAPEEVAALPAPRQPQRQYFWEYCLRGIDTKTKEYTGPLRISVSLVKLPPGLSKHLTDRQEQLVDLTGAHSTVPTPVAVTSPSTTPGSAAGPRSPTTASSPGSSATSTG